MAQDPVLVAHAVEELLQVARQILAHLKPELDPQEQRAALAALLVRLALSPEDQARLGPAGTALAREVVAEVQARLVPERH